MKTITKTCRGCGEDRPHGVRADDQTKPRALCRKCSSTYLRSWRSKNWQQRKLRDTWRGMVDRCYRPHRSERVWLKLVPRWRDYGAKGVKVCARWRGNDGFKLFCEDMGPPPTLEHTLDRINPRFGYRPSNCRWADPKTQAENRKNTVWVTAKHPETGEVETRCLGDWQRETGIDRRTISRRLRRGWSPDAAVLVEASRVSGVPF
jgi:hypothetical protein